MKVQTPNNRFPVNFENRWFCKDGKGKRVPRELEPFRQTMTDAKMHVMNGNAIEVAYCLNRNFQIDNLDKAISLAVYCLGIYNRMNFGIYNDAAYKRGKEIADAIRAKLLP